MAGLQPWVSCLLTGMLIQYLEDQHPEAARRAWAKEKIEQNAPSQL